MEGKLKEEIESLKQQNKLIKCRKEKLKEENELLKNRIEKFKDSENQIIKDEIDKNNKEDIVNQRKEANIKANKLYGVPIRKDKEFVGKVTENIPVQGKIVVNQSLIVSSCYNNFSLTRELLLHSALNIKNKTPLTTHEFKNNGPIGFAVLVKQINRHECNIIYRFNEKQISSINLEELYPYEGFETVTTSICNYCKTKT